MIDNEDLEHRFKYHAPNAAKTKKHEMTRAYLKDIAAWVNEDFSTSREVSLAMTKIEEAMFWLNAHIARNE